MTSLILLSFFAGILTVLAPCVLPLLPIIIGSSVAAKDKNKPYWITLGLVVSITIFTLILKASTLLLNVDPFVWKIVSGGIVIIFGLIYIFPKVWEKITTSLNLSNNSNQLLNKAKQKDGILGSLLIGGALGPVFASCSPTYSLIIATVLPVNFYEGLAYIVIYALGLGVVMLGVALFGRAFTNKLKFFSNPNGIFKLILGIIFLVVGISIITGFDKKVETAILNSGYFDVTKIEQNILEKNMPKEIKLDSTTAPVLGQTNFEKVNSMKSIPELNVMNPISAPEIKGITQWINSKGESIESLKGKVVLVDFWTYSCINCQRTLPYVTKWYDTYKDKGFVVLGLHAPEFSFEKIPANVERVVQDNKINYPIGLDNDFATWNNYKNQFWPASYLIDKEGKIRRTHFGEGQYAETEKAIQYLLGEKSESMVTDKVTLNEQGTKGVNQYCTTESCTKLSPETYLGSSRTENFINNTPPTNLKSNQWTIDNNWQIDSEKITTQTGSKLSFKINAQKVFLVAGSNTGTKVKVLLNNKLINTINIKESKLYTILNNPEFVVNGLLELEFDNSVEANAFTFG